MQSQRALSPPQIAAKLGVSPSKIVHFIRGGEMEGINVAAKLGGRPRYRVTESALADFMRRRAAAAPIPQPRKIRRRDAAIIEFF